MSIKIWLIDEKQHKMSCTIEDGKRVIILPKKESKLYELWRNTLYANEEWEHELFKHIFCYQERDCSYRYYLGYAVKLKI